MWIEFGAERALDRPIVRKLNFTPLRIVELGHLRALDISPVKSPIVVEKEPALVQIWKQRSRGGGCERNGKQSECTTQAKNQTSSHQGNKPSVSIVNRAILRIPPNLPQASLDRRIVFKGRQSCERGQRSPSPLNASLENQLRLLISKYGANPGQNG